MQKYKPVTQQSDIRKVLTQMCAEQKSKKRKQNKDNNISTNASAAPNLKTTTKLTHSVITRSVTQSTINSHHKIHKIQIHKITLIQVMEKVI